MEHTQRISARLRLAGRGLAGLAVACLLAFAITYAITYAAAGSPPDNDNFATAITLASSPANGTTVEATTETSEPLSLAAAATPPTRGQTVWGRWVPPTGAASPFAATGTAASPTIGVFTGSAVNALSEVTSDADADPGTGFESRVFLAADAGTTYYIQVGVK